MRRFLSATSLVAIGFESLERLEIRGIVCDLDNTCVRRRCDVPGERETAWLRAARQRGYAVVLLSNNRSDVRVATIGRLLGVPAIARARKPWPAGFRQALRILGTDPARTIVIGDQLFTDVLGAWAFGLGAILVPSLGSREEWYLRALRGLERWCVGRLALAPLP